MSKGWPLWGLSADASIPEVDFAMLARALGASGLRVEREADLLPALSSAMAATGPFVLDVKIDPTCPALSQGRNRALLAQMPVSFPRTA